MAERGTQIHAEVTDKVGKLAEVTDALSTAGVNILAAVAWVEGGRGHIRMITDDNDKACDAVQGVVDKCECGEALWTRVPNEVGALGKVSHALGDAGIAIKLIYATTAGDESLVVLDTSDNAKAAEIV